MDPSILELTSHQPPDGWKPLFLLYVHTIWETGVWSLGPEDPPGEGNGYLLQYSCLESSMDRGAWRATVAESQTQLRDEHFHFHCSVMSNSLWPQGLQSSPPDSSVHEVFQARILEWLAISFFRGSSRPRDRTCISQVSCIAGGFFTTEPPGKPYFSFTVSINVRCSLKACLINSHGQNWL